MKPSELFYPKKREPFPLRKLTLLLLSVIFLSSTIFAQGVCSSLKANAGRDTSICKGTNFLVGASPTATGGLSPYTYQWTAINDTLSSTVFANPVASPYKNSTFIVRVTDANGCIARDTMIITVGTCNVVCNGATGPNLLGSMGTFSSPYITPNNTTSAACIRSGTANAPFDNIGNPKPNQTTYVYSQTNGGLGPEGRYTFVKALGDGPTANCLHNDFRGADRTGDGGYFMAINGSPNQTSFGATFFKLDSIPVCPKTDYEFSAWLANLKTGTQSHPAGSFPNIAFFINNVIVAVSGPVGPTTGQWFNNWQKSGGTWNSENEPYANIRIDNYTFVASGNDLALDDIHFKICGPVIVSQTSRTLYCEGDEVNISDSVACTNGQLYSWFRWQRSLDGGLTWTNASGIQSSGNNAFYPATLAPFTATPALDNSKYRLMVSLDSNSLADANPNCIIYGSITTIKVGTAPVIKAQMFDTICPGTEAILEPKIDGGTAPFYLQWMNVQTNATASTPTYQFPVNQSTVIILNVTDTAGCKASDTIHFESAPILNFKKGIANVLCNGGNTGSIEIVIDTFAAPYIFTWVDGNASNLRSKLAAGSYRLTISDRFGCTVADSSVITQPSLFNATSTVNHVACSIDNTGAIQLNVSGGVAPYQFAWSNSATTQFISGLNGGNYAVTISDSNACSITRNIKINQSDSISANIVTTAVSCFGTNTGTATVTVSGGTTPYQYLWSNGNRTNAIQNLASGNFAVTITDAAGCTKIAKATITSVAQLTTSITKTDATCFGEKGKAKAIVSGGTAPFTFAWSNGGSADSIANISAGNYAVTITDANNCSATANTSITQPDSISLSGIAVTKVLCFGNTTGSITITTVAGGTAHYTYTWSNGATTKNISGIAAGSYTITVTDSRGCTVTRSFMIAQPSAALTANGIATNLSCFNQNNGGITLSVSGGTPNYTYVWSNGASSAKLNSIAAGSYSITVRDANNCSVTQSFTITQPQQLAVAITKTDATCFGDKGKAKAIVSGGTAPFTFAWSNGSAVDSISNVAAGTYAVTITDANNCSATANASITQPDSISLSGIATTNVLCFGNNTGGVSITTVAGGTAPYTYTWSNGATTKNISGLAAGSYTITVTDSKRCSTTRSFVIAQPSAALNVSGTATNLSCFNQNNGSITLTVTGGTTPYAYNWSNAASTSNLNNIPAGSYSVTVRDANNCSAIQSFTLTQPQTLAVALSKTDATCFGDKGKAKAIVSGGTAPFTFSWSNGSAIDSISNVSAGNYPVTITDANNCSATANTSITQPDSISLSDIATTNALCFGNNTGSITIATVAGGTAPYTYTWSNGTNTKNISGVAAGSYTITVTDSRVCTAIRSFVISQPGAALNVSGVTTNLSCFNQNNGSITLSVSGGTTPYTYNWINGASTSNLNNIAAGTYSVTVRDANNCSVTQSFTITQPIQLTVAINKTDATCFGDKGKAKAIVSGGTAPFTFAWSNGGSFDSISNVSAGNYAITITDANNCSAIANTTIAQPDSFSLSGISVTNVLCFGNNTGGVTINTITGGTAPYTYVWSNGATTKNISGVAAGNYTITVTDSRDCTATRSFTITKPSAALNVSGVTTNLSCFNQNNGSITLSVSGGTQNYTYTWSNGATTQNLNNIAAGNYSVTVRDANNCSVTQSFTIAQPQQLSASITKTDATCFGNKGKAKATILGGTAPFTFAWSNGGSVDSISNVSAGSYAVTIIDANNCSATANTSITQPDSVSLSGIAVTNVLCFGNNTGSITSNTISGGTAPYIYAWSNGASTKNINGIAAGSYAINVTDSRGCSATRGFVIAQPSAALKVSGTATNLSCFNQNNGNITLSVTGGTASYTYIWSNGATSQNLNNIAAGSYSVTVRDANNCSAIQSFTITQPQQLAVAINKIDATCFGDKGKAKAIVSGGTPPFTFAWSNGSSIDSITKVSAGNYAVTVSDLNGCSTTASVTITQPDSISLSGIAVTNVLCFGNTTGSITITTVAGGTAPYTYTWSNGATTKNISGVTAGNYSITVTDSKGCTATRGFVITQPSAALNISGVATNLSCFNQNNGSIALSVSGGIPGYTYNWSNSATSQNLNNIAAGTYSVTVRDANNCSVTQSFNITQPQTLAVALSKTDATCFGDRGKAKAIASGGTAPFTFAWSNGSSIDSISNVSAGTYSLTVTDANNCSVTSNTTITQPDSISLSGIAVTNVLCFGNNTGSITINTIVGGTAPYTYAWSNGATTKNISGVAAGSYTITVTDSKGCSATRSFTITQPSAALSVSGVATNLTCFNQNNGSITLSVVGGTLDYTYTGSNGASASSLNNIAAGTYSFTVRDANNCSVTQSFTITQPQTLAVTINKTHAKCFGDKGKARAIVSGGTTPFTYAWSNGGSFDSISNVSAGNYAVTITDANNCSTTANTSITQPDSISLSGIAITNVLCFGNNTGSVTINTIAGGTAPYTYLWSNGETTKNISSVAASNYTITITDAKGCSATRSFAITQPSAVLSASGTTKNLTCFNQNDGAIQLNVSGGTVPYTYAWSNGSQAKHQTAIGSDNYAVTVSDANGCSATESFSIIQPDSFTVNAAIAHIACHNDANGKIHLSVSGATAPYSFAWSNQFTAAQILNLASGTYRVTIADSRNCSVVKSYSVSQPSAALQATAAITNASCNNVSNGSIQLATSGGTTPYNYAWNTGAGTNNIQQIAAGSYQATISDANGCSTTINASITQPDSLKLNATIRNVSCTGTNSGSIDLQPIGGTAPYIYNWSNGKVTQDISQLSNGTYSVQVADSKSCYATGSFAITQPQPLTISGSPSVTHVSCNGTATGCISIQVQGGSTPYKFVWNNGATTSSISNLPAGNYSVTITDASQCSLTVNQSVTQPSAIQVNMYKTDETCFDKRDGTASATATGGTPPYRYFWNNGVANPMIANLSKGNYALTVSDANACSLQSQALIASPDSLKAFASIKPISCNGKTDGAVTLSVQGGTNPYQYQWSNGAGTSGANNLAAGVYSAIITDAKGCSTVGSYTVKQPDPLQLSLNKNDITCNSKNNGLINLNVTGGIPPYSFLWTNNQTTTTVSNLGVGAYAVTVKDANQCSKSDSTNIMEPSPIIVAAAITDAKCLGEASGAVVTLASGGVAPYSYLWNTGSTQKDIQQIAAGTYKLTVADNNGCTRIAQATVAQPQPIQIQFAAKDNKCFGGSEGEVQTSVTGGNLPYTYAWSNGGNTPSIKAVISGDYVLDIKDVKGCVASGVAHVNQPSELTASITTKGVSCINQNSGSSTITASGGAAPYQYVWMTGNTSNTIANLSANTVVSVDVKDANGCTVRQQDTIREIPAMNLDAITENISCKKNAVGSISVTVENGATPYHYAWSNGQKNSSIVVNAAGSYGVTVTDRNGCTVAAHYTITADSGFTINTIPAQTIKPGDVVELTTNTTSSAIRTWMWSPANFDAGLDCSNCQSPGAQPKKTTTYMVKAIDTKGCEALDTVTISVIADHTIFTPNMFSPNGDGVNDVFEIYGNHDALKEYDIKIFNRWGEKIYQSTDPRFQWDGTYRGVQQDPGVFVYYMKVVFLDGFKPDDDGKGSITLVR